ncbi:MAG: hypothetical protein LBV79_09850 [Candidatus Adiutrix sp.]|jgi:hypothetical protein|nr:hypothetical protein [Candidatus Adiutrix sp.]
MTETTKAWRIHDPERHQPGESMALQNGDGEARPFLTPKEAANHYGLRMMVDFFCKNDFAALEKFFAHGHNVMVVDPDGNDISCHIFICCRSWLRA